MAVQLPVRIVSLERSGRRERIASVMSTHEVEFAFVDAVDAQDLSDDEFAQSYDDAAARSRYGRSLSRGEVACFLSHRRIWEFVATSARGVIVLEDDALLEPEFFGKVLSSPEERLAQIADVVLLGRSKLSKASEARTYLYEPLKRADRIAGMRIGTPFKQWTSGAVGYWMSPRGAALALAHTQGPVRALLDDWPWHRDEGGLSVKELRPYVVWEAFESMASALEGDRSRLTSARANWREWYRMPFRVVRLVVRWSVATAICIAEAPAKSRAVSHD